MIHFWIIYIHTTSFLLIYSARNENSEIHHLKTLILSASNLIKTSSERIPNVLKENRFKSPHFIMWHCVWKTFTNGIYGNAAISNL